MKNEAPENSPETKKTYWEQKKGNWKANLSIRIFFKKQRILSMIENPLASRELRIFLDDDIQNPCFYSIQLWEQPANQKQI